MALADIRNSILRFIDNEKRADDLVNDPGNKGYYTTRRYDASESPTGSTILPRQIETFPAFVKRQQTIFQKIQHEGEAAAALNRLATLTVNYRTSWKLTAAVSSGSLMSIPGSYYPGRGMIMLAYNGLICDPTYPTNESNYPYEEVGATTSLSRQIRLRFNASAGAVFSLWVVGFGNARAEAAADRADAAAERAEISATKAQASEGIAQKWVAKSKEQADRAEQEANRSRDEADRSKNEADRSAEQVELVRRGAEEALSQIKAEVEKGQRLLALEIKKAQDAALEVERQADRAKGYAEQMADSMDQVRTIFAALEPGMWNSVKDEILETQLYLVDMKTTVEHLTHQAFRELNQKRIAALDLCGTATAVAMNTMALLLESEHTLRSLPTYEKWLSA